MGLPYSEATYEKDTYMKEHHSDKIALYETMKNADTKPLRRQLHHRPKFVKFSEQPPWVPDTLKLRDYQIDGLNWLAHSWCKYVVIVYLLLML